jgi:hypothetical protein
LGSSTSIGRQRMSSRVTSNIPNMKSVCSESPKTPSLWDDCSHSSFLGPVHGGQAEFVKSLRLRKDTLGLCYTKQKELWNSHDLKKKMVGVWVCVCVCVCVCV